jgi:hypothetical protein
MREEKKKKNTKKKKKKKNNATLRVGGLFGAFFLATMELWVQSAAYGGGAREQRVKRRLATFELLPQDLSEHHFFWFFSTFRFFFFFFFFFFFLGWVFFFFFFFFFFFSIFQISERGGGDVLKTVRSAHSPQPTHRNTRASVPFLRL